MPSITADPTSAPGARARSAGPVLVLSASMGGGHLQIGRELARRLTDRDHEVDVVDLLELMPAPTGRWLHDLYPWLVNRTPRLYQRIYDTFFVAGPRTGARVGLPVRLALPALRRYLAHRHPRLAVSTYPLASVALGELRSRGALRCPAVTVVTTFSLNNLWVHPAMDHELCISGRAAADAAGRTGRPAGVSGPIVRPGFAEERDPAPVRRALGIRDGMRMALVATGSMGLAGSAEAAARILATHHRWVPVVLCGRSAPLVAAIGRVPGAVPIEWADDMPGLMAAADVLVDNNCGMTAKEALASSLPVVTFRPISGHGRDDASAMQELGLTSVVEDAKELRNAVDELTDRPGVRRRRTARGRALFVADAAEQLEQLSSLAGR